MGIGVKMEAQKIWDACRRSSDAFRKCELVLYTTCAKYERFGAWSLELGLKSRRTSLVITVDGGEVRRELGWRPSVKSW